MRFIAIAAAAMLALLSVDRRANACADVLSSAQIASVEYSAEMEKKPVRKLHKHHTKKHHQAKEKVEYMRAAPMK